MRYELTSREGTRVASASHGSANRTGECTARAHRPVHTPNPDGERLRRSAGAKTLQRRRLRMSCTTAATKLVRVRDAAPSVFHIYRYPKFWGIKMTPENNQEWYNQFKKYK